MIGMKSFLFFIMMLIFLPTGTSKEIPQSQNGEGLDFQLDGDRGKFSTYKSLVSQFLHLRGIFVPPTVKHVIYTPEGILAEPGQSKSVVAQRVSTANNNDSLSTEFEIHILLTKNSDLKYAFKKRLQHHPRDKDESTSLPKGTITLEYSPTVFIPSQRVSATSVLVLENEDSSLTDLLLHVVEKELAECDLFLGYDEGYSDSIVLQRLALLPNAKQVLHISSTAFTSILWTSTRCLGYLFLLSKSQNILTFTNKDLHSWNYHGRFVFAGLSLEDIDELVSSEKGKKTEHIIGIVKSSILGEWNLYMNQLFWGEGVQRINIWKENRFTSELNIFPDKISNLRGAQLKATTFVWEPDVLYYTDDDGSVQFLYGNDVEVAEALAQVLNFTVVYGEPPNDEMWGDISENGTWSGTLAIIERDETDMIFPLYVAEQYTSVLDYTMPYRFELSCFAVKMEPPLPSWQALLYPFHLWTWFSLLIGLVLSGPILFLLTKASTQFGEEIKTFQSLLGSCQSTFGMHLNKSLDLLPKSTSVQFYILFLWLYCYIITIAYSSTLTAFLTVKKPPPRMETIKDLHDSGSILVGVDNFYQDMFMASPDIYLHNLAKTYKIVRDQNEIFRRLRLGSYVYQGNKPYLDFMIATKFTKRGGVSELRVMKECFALHSSAIAVQNNSPLKRKFNEVLGGMMSGGLISRYFINTLRLAASTKEYSVTEDESAGDDVEEKKGTGKLVPLSLEHMQGVIFITVFGWTFAFLAFLVEMTAPVNVHTVLTKNTEQLQ